jgi:threonine dehydrogenase-like Zn-dependent dehydrogenase
LVRSRYAELVEPGKFVIKEETLEPNDEQLLIRITHCGLCQYDISYFKGIVGKTPMSIGHEPVGVVEAVGRNVKGFAPGDRVTGLYAYLRSFATYGLAEPHQLVRVPDHIPSEQALAEPLKCIATILRSAPPEFADHVLVMGTGFMGLLIIAGLVGRGLSSLIAADIRQDRLDMAKEFGATHTLNSRDPNFLDQVQAITNGHGIDVAFEVTSNAEPVELAAKTLRRTRGRFVLAGWHGQPGTYTLRNWTTRGAIILGAHPAFSQDEFEDMRRAMDGLARGVFPMHRLITHRFPLDEIQTGFEIAMTGRDGYIKGVITP